MKLIAALRKKRNQRTRHYRRGGAMALPRRKGRFFRAAKQKSFSERGDLLRYSERGKVISRRKGEGGEYSRLEASTWRNPPTTKEGDICRKERGRQFFLAKGKKGRSCITKVAKEERESAFHLGEGEKGNRPRRWRGGWEEKGRAPFPQGKGKKKRILSNCSRPKEGKGRKATSQFSVFMP